MTRPLCIDLFCGLGGWTEGFLAEGYSVIGFDIERHVYGEHRYPAHLVLQDVRTLHGSQFKDATIIVASSPCQEFSYRAMPWKRAKALPPPLLGMELFAQAARIQREAIEASGRYIPMIQENVCGAQNWVGRARWHYGPYYLWGDVPALMPIVSRRDVAKVPGQNWNGFNENGKTSYFNMAAIKNNGGSWFNVAHNTTIGKNNNPGHGVTLESERIKMDDGVKQGGDWFNDPKSGSRPSGNKSLARKSAAARIAKIPFPLASHIARCFHPASSDPASSVELSIVGG